MAAQVEKKEVVDPNKDTVEVNDLITKYEKIIELLENTEVETA
jgi:hypothetical protein